MLLAVNMGQQYREKTNLNISLSWHTGQNILKIGVLCYSTLLKLLL
jgi:hypothetical protein